jgi:hypothetical protein
MLLPGRDSLSLRKETLSQCAKEKMAIGKKKK